MSLNILQAAKSLNRTLPNCATTLLAVKNNEIDLCQKRTVIYYDRNTGRRHTDPDAAKRFYRLHWGGWIRTRAGRSNHLWKKPWYIKWYTRQHVFCTPEMSETLEKLVAPDVKKPRYFIDDIYEPYNKRHGIDIVPHDRLQISKSYIKVKNDLD